VPAKGGLLVGMNILFIDLNEGYGGSVAFLLDVIDFHLARDYRVTVLVNSRSDWCDRLIDKKLTIVKLKAYPWVRSLDMRWSFFNTLKATIKALLNAISEIKIYFLIKKNNYDQVYINTVIYPNGYLSSRLSRTFQALNLHEFLDLDHRMQFIWPKFSNVAMNFSSAILFNSNLVRSHFNRSIKKKSIEQLIRNGFKISEFKEHCEYIAGGKVKIVILGRLVKSKGQLDLVIAASYLQKWGITNFLVEIYGDINEVYADTIISAISSNSLQNLVSLNGFCRDIPSMLSKVDILCVCSQYEAFGRVTIEGMLASCCIVGANSGTTAELIDSNKNGILYEAGNPLSLANELARLIFSPSKIKDLGDRGHKYAVENFSIGNMHNDLEHYLALRAPKY
jgi:glycosyltransferase involved in cell wall biosynthesis